MPLPIGQIASSQGDIQAVFPVKGRKRRGEMSFSEFIYERVCLVLWRNGWRPFTRQNVVDYCNSTFKIEPTREFESKVTFALVYLRDKKLLKCKQKTFWYVEGRQSDVKVKRFYWDTHPLPTCLNCVQLEYMYVVDRTGQKRRIPICTATNSPHYNTMVDIHYPRTECYPPTKGGWEGTKSADQLVEEGIRIGPYYPRSHFKKKQGQIVKKY